MTSGTLALKQLGIPSCRDLDADTAYIVRHFSGTGPTVMPRMKGRSGRNRREISWTPTAFAVTENKMRAFVKRFLMHYGIYRRYPLGRFPALRNAWRAAQP